jgi:hypothetical protein
MRILLTANACYDPPKGGSTRSNLTELVSLKYFYLLTLNLHLQISAIFKMPHVFE